ncbi:MAG: pilus assembly protein TadG-related protein [Chloroflexota bacterium]
MTTRPGNENGQGIVLFALVLVVVLAAVALAVDAGLAYVRSAQFAAAVDAAALAGTIDLDPATSDTQSADIRAIQFLGANGWPTSTLTSMVSSRAYTSLGIPNYTLTVTWPVEFSFARVIGLDDYSVTRRANATYYAQAEILTPSAANHGHVRLASQYVYGPEGCSEQGDPVSTRIKSPDVVNGYQPMFNGEYAYRIVVDDEYSASNALRVELMDADSFNNRADNTLINHSISDGRPDHELSCAGDTSGPGDMCVIHTGESLTALNQNPFWLQRVDENWAAGCVPVPGDGFGTVTTTFELYFYDDSGQRQILGSYTVDNARDFLYTDMQWVAPGAPGSRVPANSGSFEIDLRGIPLDERGRRTVELSVRTSSGAGKNAWDLWAGPPAGYFASQGIPELASDVNQRNLQLANNPAAYVVPGVSVYAIGRMPVTHYPGNDVIRMPLASIDSTLGGGIAYVTTYDSDGAIDANFTIDTVAAGDFNVHTTVVAVPSPGHSGTSADPLQASCNGGRDCNGNWMLPQYAMRVPEVFFAGGTLEANYMPAGDDFVWSIGFTSGRPYLTD